MFQGLGKNYLTRNLVTRSYRVAAFTWEGIKQNKEAAISTFIPTKASSSH